MNMWAMIGIIAVLVIVAVIITKFTDIVMTDEQKNDDTPVFYQDENGIMQQTTKAEQTRKQIGNGCLWLIGAVILFVVWLMSLGGC